MGKLFVTGLCGMLSIATAASASAQRRCPDPEARVSVPLSGSARADAAADMDADVDVEAEQARAFAAGLGGLIVEADGVADAELWLDGALVGRLPMRRPIYLPEGETELVLRIRGRGETDVEVDIERGVVARVEADVGDLRPLGAVADVGATATGVVGGVATGALGGLGVGGGARADVDTPEVDAPDVGDAQLDAPGDLDADVEADTGLSPWFWVAGVVGAVAVIGGITATVVHGNLSSDFEALGCDGPTPGPMCEDLDADVSLASGFQVGGFVLGGVALVGAGLIFALSGSADADEELELDCPTGAVARTAPTTAVCSPFASPDGAGAACALTF